VWFNRFGLIHAFSVKGGGPVTLGSVVDPELRLTLHLRRRKWFLDRVLRQFHELFLPPTCRGWRAEGGLEGGTPATPIVAAYADGLSEADPRIASFGISRLRLACEVGTRIATNGTEGAISPSAWGGQRPQATHPRIRHAESVDQQPPHMTARFNPSIQVSQAIVLYDG